MKLLSTTDAAHAAGVQPATIRKWHERGKLTRYGSARSPRWRLDELTSAATRRRLVLAKALDICHDAGTTTGSVPRCRADR